MPTAVARHIGIAVGHPAVHFCGEHDLMSFAVALQRGADDFLAPSATVDIGSIEEVNPRLDRLVDNGE